MGLFYGKLEIAGKFCATVSNFSIDFGEAALAVATWEVNMIWQTEKFCGCWIYPRSASVAGVHTFILSFDVFFMSISSFRPMKRRLCFQTLVSHLWRWRWLDQQRRSPLHLLRQSYRKPWHPREIAPHCVSIFSQSLQERLRRGLCRTRRCYGWKRTARQCWTRTADLGSTTAVGWTPASGRCFPVTLCRPSVCWALRRTT